MARKPRTLFDTPAARKTRTREHVIASQSVAHIEKFIFGCGYVAERPLNDYGYDLSMTTFSPNGGVEPGNVWFQLKATDALPVMQNGSTIAYPLRWEDVSLWREEPMPVILVVYDAAQEVAYWTIQAKHPGPDAGDQAL